VAGEGEGRASSSEAQVDAGSGVEAGAGSLELESRPWAAGVGEELQILAKRRFAEGNTYFERRAYREALTRYEEALQSWRHPAIEFNAAVCLINLERSAEALEMLKQALRFGEDPLGPALHSQGLTYRTLLMGQLARLELSCEQEGSKISLDGRPILSCPGELLRWLPPGKHQLIARRAGFASKVMDREFGAGVVLRERVELIPLEEAVRSVRRFNAWIPWAVMGSGLVLVAGGGGFQRLALDSAKSYDESIANQCAGGCLVSALPLSVTKTAARARVTRALANSLYIGGGAAAAIGVVLFVLNLPRNVPIENSLATKLRWFPSVGPAGATLNVELNF